MGQAASKTAGPVGAAPTTAEWADLERELAHWHERGETASLWWRDDDAVRLTPALERLLAIGAGIPLALAVIPGRVAARDSTALFERLAEHGAASVLQHGWMHANHAPAEVKKMELGPHRPIATMLGELATGWRMLSGIFGRLALPVLTPPWNRIAAALTPLLHEAGYRGISTAGPRASGEPWPGLVQVNTHADLLAWPGGGFIGAPLALGRLVGHLRARRAGTVDPAEPTGLLTHHLRHDAATEAFLALLLARLRAAPAVRWVGAAEAFAGP